MNNSIKHLSFVYTEFKFQAVLFDTYIGPNQLLPLRASVDLGAMAMKENFEFHNAPELLEPHHKIV